MDDGIETVLAPLQLRPVDRALAGVQLEAAAQRALPDVAAGAGIVERRIDAAVRDRLHRRLPPRARPAAFPHGVVPVRDEPLLALGPVPFEEQSHAGKKLRPGRVRLRVASLAPDRAAPGRALVCGMVWTIGHGARTAEDLLLVLRSAGVQTLVDVRRFPGSRRHPQFNQAAFAAVLDGAGIQYVHEIELGGLRSGEPGEERFDCIDTPAFRSYAARMSTAPWQEALERSLALPAPCFMCAETLWWRCHRRLIADLLVARGHGVLHLFRRDETQQHQLGFDGEIRDGKLYLCGELVA